MTQTTVQWVVTRRDIPTVYPPTPQSVVFSHVDNYHDIKSRGILLAYAGAPRWPMRAPALSGIFVAL